MRPQIRDAIKKSIIENRIVLLDAGSKAELQEILDTAEDYVMVTGLNVTQDVYDCWGTDEDCDEWRVIVTC